MSTRRLTHQASSARPSQTPLEGRADDAIPLTFDTVAHPRAPGALALSLTGRGIWKSQGEKNERHKQRRASYA